MSSTMFEPPGPGQPAIRRLTTTTHYRRLPWLPLLIALVIVPIAITALAVFVGRSSVEDDLRQRTEVALASAGLPDVRVDFDGRDATISNVASDRAETAKDTVLGVDGVRVADVDGVIAPAAAATGKPFEVRIVGDKIVLTGDVRDENARNAVVDAARAASGGAPVVDELTFNSAAQVLDPAQVRAAVEDARRISPPLPTQQPQQGDKAALQQQINQLIAGGRIAFSPNSSDLTSEGSATVAKVADLLRPTRVRIEVDGHVADTGENVNSQAVSEQRARTVKARLVELGIAADRIDAVGFGSSRPVDTNSTSAGQTANRRVEIIVL
ncbi:OmpA family protein [Antrihabitans stalactiti]|nr:OmpA family protein [Antrihabitans stalactiti]